MAVDKVIRLHPDDNVVIARAALPAGLSIAGENLITAEPIPAGHKLAVRALAPGDPVLRYGQIIGFATQPVAPGRHLHTHNCGMGDFQRDYAFGSAVKPTDYIQPQASFMGILRPDGRVATRNYIGILTTVNCSATAAKYVADAFRANPFTGSNPLADYPNVDGVVALTHKLGCGLNTQGEGIEVLRRTIAGYARHPNFHSVIVIGLGCEGNQIDALLEAEGLQRGPHLHTLTIQETGGTEKTVRAAMAMVQKLLPEANAVQRQKLPVSHLTIGLQCGGSDGYSGISANPALGVASDLIVRHGGTVILSETPETYGAEHLLTRRAVTPQVGQKLVDLMAWWADYTVRNGGEMDNNPSPGNKAGGITTILEKSLGAAAKAGSTNLVEVYRYAEAATARGFVFMDSPGYDPVSATGQVASGANLVCFTTGRGSVFGCRPAPSLKLATNSELYARMTEDMDIDCGGVVDGQDNLEQLGRRIFDLILATASGQPSKSEKLGFGEEEFAPWSIGAVR